MLLLAGVLALAVAGVWLVATWKFPAPHILFGIALLGLAVALRPRFGRVDPKVEVLSRHRAPELFRLIDEVAVAVNAPAPHVVAVNEEFNAYATEVGLRRRRVLCLGLPLWGSLEPQERVALLGHELGHFVNGDVRRGLLTQPAFTTLGTVADLVRPVETIVSAQSGLVALGEALGKAVQWILARLFFGAHLLLVWIGLRDGQRAEYLADELGARVGGSAAATSLLDAFLAGETIDMVVRREARAGNSAGHWRKAAGEARSHIAERRPLLRMLSIRDETSLFASHPPSGLRARMVEARPWRTPAVVLTEARVEQIDTELAKDYERARRQLAWAN